MTQPLDVMVVEDDPLLCELLAARLSGEGWAVRSTTRGDEAVRLALQKRPDILVLDVMLPGLTGIEVCKRVRDAYTPPPGVVFVSALGSELDVIMGFDVGADDYVVKPCRPSEIVARVRALARRVRPCGEALRGGRTVTVGGLRVDSDRHQASVDGRPVRLTPTEFALLAELARNQGRVFSRVDLLAAVWETSHEGYARNVDCHITRLRRKLEIAGLSHVPIQTVHGVGYTFDPGREP